MDVRYINPFIASVRNVFKTMLATEVNVSKPVIKAQGEASADVSSVIGLSGDATGCVVLSFPMHTAVAVASKFAGIAMTATHEDFSDALGELANMVAGHAKASLEGLNLNISLPTVVVGREHLVSQSKLAPRLALPCDSTLGRFCVEVVMVAATKRKEAAGMPATVGAGA